MSEAQKNPAPACPLCAGDTVLKNILHDTLRAVHFYVCRACSVEFPVFAPRE